MQDDNEHVPSPEELRDQLGQLLLAQAFDQRELAGLRKQVADRGKVIDTLIEQCWDLGLDIDSLT